MGIIPPWLVGNSTLLVYGKKQKQLPMSEQLLYGIKNCI